VSHRQASLHVQREDAARLRLRRVYSKQVRPAYYRADAPDVNVMCCGYSKLVLEIQTNVWHEVSGACSCVEGESETLSLSCLAMQMK
jgi:hypothetical protein